jgi:hypothetical protein
MLMFNMVLHLNFIYILWKIVIIVIQIIHLIMFSSQTTKNVKMINMQNICNKKNYISPTQANAKCKTRNKQT